VESSLQWIELFRRETGSTEIGISDPVTTTDILGPSFFQEFSKPYMRKLIDGIVGITGAKPSLHICGHTKKIWKDLKELGVESFSLDNCENMEEAKQAMGDQIFLSGNVSPVEAMFQGSIDDVIEAVKTSLRQGSDSPSGFMVMTGCQVPIGTPKENIDAYIYAAQKYGADARIGRLCKGIES
jgi:uroporphyrinogen decarboxylase